MEAHSPVRPARHQAGPFAGNAHRRGIARPVGGCAAHGGGRPRRAKGDLSRPRRYSRHNGGRSQSRGSRTRGIHRPQAGRSRCSPSADLAAMMSLMVRAVGVEPTLLSEPDFESGASANSATPAMSPPVLRSLRAPRWRLKRFLVGRTANVYFCNSIKSNTFSSFRDKMPHGRHNPFESAASTISPLGLRPRPGERVWRKAAHSSHAAAVVNEGATSFSAAFR